MAVPKTSQLWLGIRANVVVKADQRSGRLTTGQVSEILTRGDHPRGIKVRLSTGQVGRVQSLATPPQGPAAAQTRPCLYGNSGQSSEQESTHPSGKRYRKSAPQENYRQDPFPLASATLADYIRGPSPSKRHANASGRLTAEDNAQSKLEKDFPNVDSALIAAILADHEEIDGARDVLITLS